MFGVLGFWGFITKLADEDPDFAKIKPDMIKTTNDFFEFIRIELKNKMVKIRNETSKTQVEQAHEEEDDDEEEDEEEQEEDQSEDSDNDEDKVTEQQVRKAISKESVNDDEDKPTGKPTTVPKKKNSKKIKKTTSDNYWIEFGKRYPDKWSELHFLRETIVGREWELKWFRMKLKKKASNFLAQPSPKLKDLMNILKKD